MKNLLLGLALLAPTSAFADISKKCQEEIDNLISHHQYFENILSRRIFPHTAVKLLRKINKNTVKVEALSCTDGEEKIAHDEVIRYYEKHIKN